MMVAHNMPSSHPFPLTSLAVYPRPSSCGDNNPPETFTNKNMNVPSGPRTSSPRSSPDSVLELSRKCPLLPERGGVKSPTHVKPYVNVTSSCALKTRPPLRRCKSLPNLTARGRRPTTHVSNSTNSSPKSTKPHHKRTRTRAGGEATDTSLPLFWFLPSNRSRKTTLKRQPPQKQPQQQQQHHQRHSSLKTLPSVDVPRQRPPTHARHQSLLPPTHTRHSSLLPPRPLSPPSASSRPLSPPSFSSRPLSPPSFSARPLSPPSFSTTIASAPQLPPPASIVVQGRAQSIELQGLSLLEDDEELIS